MKACGARHGVCGGRVVTVGISSSAESRGRLRERILLKYFTLRRARGPIYHRARRGGARRRESARPMNQGRLRACAR